METNLQKAKTNTKKKLDPKELARVRLQRRHRREVREIFSTLGFQRADSASDKEFTFKGTTSDFDDVFILENVVIFTEYTITNDVSAHIKQKYLMYENIKKAEIEFIRFSRNAPLNIGQGINEKYSDNQLIIIILYCSYSFVDAKIKQQFEKVNFMDYEIVRYFKMLTRTIKLSARHEFLAFLGVPFGRFSERALSTNAPSRDAFRGSVLPEDHSKFPSGYKIVSFYIEPAALLSRAYVLRRDGWRDKTGVYQRMILRKKLDAIRKYLVEQKRVFVNNIIITLPSGTKIVDEKENTIDTSTLTQTRPATITIPNEYNSIGLIDGQHRVFSYYEGGANESIISLLRSQQNLLVSGIIYPSNISETQKIRFEAGLFLEINSTQSNARSDLKQSINQLIRPFMAESIAREVLDKLNERTGALSGVFAQSVFDVGSVRTTSVVSYGLRPLVRPHNNGPIFTRWNDPEKDTFVSTENDEARKRYVDFCTNQVAIFFAAAQACLPRNRWTTSRDTPKRLLTPTFVNGLLGAMRQALEGGVIISFEELKSKFNGIQDFPFEKYKSSQYTVMSSDIYREFLSK